MNVVIPFEHPWQAEMFVEALRDQGVISDTHDFKYMSEEVTKDAIVVHLDVAEYDEDGFSDFDNDE
jgi:hypothetical protein